MYQIGFESDMPYPIDGTHGTHRDDKIARRIDQSRKVAAARKMSHVPSSSFADCACFKVFGEIV
jgi:hypothetical protein